MVTRRVLGGACVCSTDLDVKAKTRAAEHVAADLGPANLTFPDDLKEETSCMEEQLQIAVWEAREFGICFHQPLNINQSVLFEEDDHDATGSSINYNHPFHIHSPIRAQLNVDCPANATGIDPWRKWLDKDGMHLCVLVASRDNTDPQFKYFLRHYYDLQQFPGSYFKCTKKAVALASCSPLLVVRSRVLRSELRNGNEGEHVTLSNLSSTADLDMDEWMAYPGRQHALNVSVMEWLSPLTLEEEASAVFEFVQRNVIQGCNCTIRWSADAKKRELGCRIVDRMASSISSEYHASSAWLSCQNISEIKEVCLKLLPNIVRDLRTLDILCRIWRLPPTLKQQLLITLNISEGVDILYIICVIVFCKWKCNKETKLSFKVEETTKYYGDMIDYAIKECQRFGDVED